MKNGDFKIKLVTVSNGPFTYTTYRLRGWLQGQYIRQQFQSREEALGAKLRFEVKAANSGHEIRAVNTRLKPEQLAQAEAAFARLGDRSLSQAVDFYLAEWKPPLVGHDLSAASLAFQAARKTQWSAPYARDTKRVLKAFCASLPAHQVHEVTTSDVQQFLSARKIGPKGHNNVRGQIHALLEFCREEPRRWTRENPVTPIAVLRVARGIPEILTAARVAEVMAYVESYAGGPRSRLPAGCLVPYFALTTFAGIRPALPGGEIWKLGRLKSLARVIDPENGVIRLGPDVAKTRDLRQITIQPNLRAWLDRYPLKKFKVVMPNLAKMVTEVRAKFGLTHDVLRHTFISMHVAKFRSLGGTALEAGNSERIIRRHYLNMVTAAEADAFWAVMPNSLAPGPDTTLPEEVQIPERLEGSRRAATSVW